MLIRITPADAGKTFCRRLLQADTRDHPRGCGENLSTALKAKQTSGSPPRMRGKPAAILSASISLRITPADAGKTQSLHRTTRTASDHPRGCGENTSSGVISIICPGSPPRMRGKPQCYRVRKPPAGITPADAGKTSAGQYSYSLCWDHPRGCGENITSVLPVRKM